MTIDTKYFLSFSSPAMKKVFAQCRKVATSNANILLVGASGTGKEVAAKYIHAHSKRAHKNFVAVNCTAYTDTLLESELFGHEQGAFTGAIKSRTGKFEQSHEGTFFLDEVGDISLTTQVKLLRVLESKQVTRIGNDHPHYIDFRLISATNLDLPEEICQDKFREDFFYRVSTIVIHMPTLHERREDLPSLISFFLAQSQKENDILIKDMEPCVKSFLRDYDFPGNIRELKNIIDRMVILSEDGIITREALPLLFNIRKEYPKASTQPLFSEIIPFRDFKQQTEKEYLQWVLTQTKGNVTHAAQKLELSPRHLFAKIKDYQLR